MESSTKTSFWASIVLGSFTVISAVIGSKIQGFAWLLYLCGVMLVTSFVILVWDRFLWTKLDNYLSKRRAMKRLKKCFGSYLKIAQKFRILEDIERVLSLDKVDWNNRRPHLFGSAQNSLSSLEHGLEDLPPEHRLIATNITLREIVRSFDGWLNTCDEMLKNGHAKYKTEDVRNEVLLLIGKHHELTSIHDEFCREINSNLNYGKLNVAGLYCQSHGFNWKNAEPQA